MNIDLIDQKIILNDPNKIEIFTYCLSSGLDLEHIDFLYVCVVVGVPVTCHLHVNNSHLVLIIPLLTYHKLNFLIKT